MKLLYRTLLLATAVVAQEMSDMPSDVPSYVPTYSPSSSPSSLPTIMGGGGDFPVCPLCPEGEQVGLPDIVLPGTGGQTCGTADAAGMAGAISPENCGLLQGAGPALCQCTETLETRAPSPAGIAPPPPSTGDCTTASCGEVMSWASLAAFVEAAESGDRLCMCGRFYADELCAGTVAVAGKDITLECVPGNFCSYGCPDTAFVVEDGASLTLVGAGENFIFTGGTMFSRIVVSAGGTFTASNVVIENTADSIAGEPARRNLIVNNGLGGGLETSGTTTMSDSRFENCTSQLSGGAVYVGGGASTFRGVSFSSNTAFEGGAIFAQEGSLVVEDSTFEGNVATNTETDPDLFTRSGVTVEVCGNTADSEALNGCSGAAAIWTAACTFLAMGLAMMLFA